MARAVKIALNEIHGSDEQTESSSPSSTEGKVEVKQFSEEEWDEARRLMESNRGKDDEQAVALIEEEFNLKNTKHEVKTAQHWDIGQRWT